MTTEYRYVGPERIRAEARAPIKRFCPKSEVDLLHWLTAQSTQSTTFTFVVSREGRILLSARETEHVALAQGANALAAGEVTLCVHKGVVEVVSITNQSTGYCPEPSCWPSVEAALEQVGIPSPGGFTHEFHFRRCETCLTIHLLKSDFSECAVCGRDLPEKWNFG